MTFTEQRHYIKESAFSMSQGANETFDNWQISGQNVCEHYTKDSRLSMSQGANETFDNWQISGQNFCEVVNFNVMSQMCHWFIANFFTKEAANT